MVRNLPDRKTTQSAKARRRAEPLRYFAWLALGAALLIALPARIPPAPGRAAPAVAAPGPARSEAAQLVEPLQQRLKTDSNDLPALDTLTLAYLQRARETADPSYYDKAEVLLQRAFAIRPDDPGALSAAGTLALARHQFVDAKGWALRARAADRGNAYNYGVLGDAQIELGEYGAAFESIQQMADRRPDLSALSRVSYARELTGDLEGAVQAMRRAAATGAPGSEPTAWVRVQLGHLFFNTGDLRNAEGAYRQALFQLPDYPHAVAGLARVQAARRNYSRAIALYTQVTERLPLPEYVIALGEVYEAAGQRQRASGAFALVEALDRLFRASGVDTDLELALFQADHGDAGRALPGAHAARDRRPSVHADDVLAWTAYRSGNLPLAREASRRALRLGSQDPLLLFHAGMVAAATGDRAAARRHLERALELNPRFSVRHADEAARTLKRLQPEGES